MARIVIPQRIRLIKLLRAHGLRAVERLREDELKDALEKLGLALPPEEPPAQAPAPRESPWSATGTKRDDDAPAPKKTPPPAAADDGRDTRFDEPPLSLPDGARTFLRLLAVSPTRLFATWDLDASDRAAPGQERLEIVAADDADGAPLATARIDRKSHGWYVDAPDERIALAARLRIGDRVVARSNVTWVPPSRPAPPGPLVFATIPASVDRRELRGGALVAARLGEPLPEGVTVSDTGERTRAEDVVPDGAPSSGETAPRGAPSSWSRPSSHVMTPAAGPASGGVS